MKKLYTIFYSSCYKGVFFFVLQLFFITGGLSGQEYGLTSHDCVDCFSAQVIGISQTDHCLNVTLEVYTDGCNPALSHLTVQIPCGVVTEVSNSKGWPSEVSVTDPSTGISGFKIDDIRNFGETGQRDSFRISYSICNADPDCLSDLQSDIVVSYKAGNCVYYDLLEEKDDFDVVLIPKEVTCFNGNDGMITAKVTGGNGPFTYEWSTGNTSEAIYNLTAGTYSVKITDTNGQSIEKSAEIVQPDAPVSISAEVTDASCNLSDGSVILGVTGGESPYTYRWSNGDTAQNLVDVIKGTYVVSVTDHRGCTASKSVKVDENTTLDASVTPNYLECYQEGEGEIVSVVSGGTAPYTYSWSSGDTTQNISDVNSGLYNLTVTDAEGCSKTKSAYIGIRSLSVSTSITNPACYGGNDGKISVVNVGYGTAPFTYAWDNGDTTATITGLESGRYVLTVTDSAGCTATRSMTVTDPVRLSLNHSVAPRNCNTDSEAEVTFEGSGGSGSYTFYLGDTLITSPVTLPGNGDYEVTMKDASGCAITETIHIASSEHINAVTSVTQPSCTGLPSGYAVITANGGTGPYDYVWSDGSSGSSRSNLAPGDYSLNIIDANGCFTTSSFTIDPVKEVTTKISDPGEVDCSADQNIVYALTSNATGFEWEIQPAGSGWTITDSTMNQATYQTGEGMAAIILHVWNEDGCEAADSLNLSCNTDEPGGTTDTTGTGISDPAGDCPPGSWDTEITRITPVDANCYRISLLVKSTGNSVHDLSHLVVGLENGYVSDLTNSANFKTEVNMTDPKSGLYGFKIDDISGFGNDGLREFIIDFEVCFGQGELPEVIPVIYKASTCWYSQALPVFTQDEETSEISVSAYPNPFPDEVNIRIHSPEDTQVNVAIYDLRGNKVMQLYDGKIAAGVHYTFPFNAVNAGNDNLFFYTVISNNEVIQGQILRIK